VGVGAGVVVGGIFDVVMACDLVLVLVSESEELNVCDWDIVTVSDVLSVSVSVRMSETDAVIDREALRVVDSE
jgi:hypothetical protein